MMVLFLRAALLYVLVFVIMRLMGKRQISDLQPFDLVVTLLVAELASDPITDTSIPLVYGIMPILALYLLQQLMSFVCLKSEKLSTVLSGKPSIVVARGVIQEHEMRKSCYTLNDLMEQLRSKDVFSVAEVEFAIVETDGTLSVLKKGKCQIPTFEDHNIKSPPVALNEVLIVDRKVHENALKRIGYDKKWLEQKLQAMGFIGTHKVFFASLDTQQNMLFVQEHVGKSEKKPRVCTVRVGRRGTDG